MNKIKVFVFDNGGTMRVGDNVIAKHFAGLGYSIKNLSALGPHAEKAEEKLDLGLINEEQFWKEVDKDLHKPTGYKTFLYDTKISYPILGMEEIVNELKANGYRVVVGTNICTPYWQKNIDDGCYSCFDARYGSCEMHVKKPDPDFYRVIAKAEGVELSEMMLIDDQIPNIDSARSVGMFGHVFQNSFDLRSELTQMGYLK